MQQGMHRAIVTLLAGLALVTIGLPAGGAGAAVRAVIVGIDQYAHVPVLDGAVADAVDLDRALRRAGAEVVTLLDDEATRANIVASWNAFAAASKADDVLILSFAGHGIQVPDLDGDEADGYDEAFVLPDFRVGQRDDANLIVDDTIDQVIRSVAPRTVVLITDTCHSGTFLRSTDPRVNRRGVRFVPRSVYDGQDRGPTAGTRDPAPPADNVVFFGAVPEELPVAEVLIDGQARGALSYAFARAMEGEADRDRDSWVSTDELQAHVPERVRAISQNRQTPETWAGPRVVGERLIPTRGLVAGTGAAPDPPPAPAPGPQQGATEGPETALTIAVAGPEAASGRPVLAKLSGVEVVDRPERADLIWHLPSGDVLTSLGDVVARLGTAREPEVVQGVVTKWRLLHALEHRIDGSLQARVRPSDRVFFGDERMAVELFARVDGELAMFDLASDGSLIRILPRPGRPAEPVANGEAIEIPLRAGPPFGADHVVAAVLPDVGRIREFLEAHHGRPLPPAAADRLLEVLAGGSVLATAIHTAP